MRILAFDTCLAACSLALTVDGEVIGQQIEPMDRGHQERLAPLVAGLMTETGQAFSNLDRIAVTIGPGSFTGLRVGLAFAKGLGAALRIPVIGVGTLEALAYLVDGPTVAVMDARRGQVYLQAFQARVALSAPDALGLEAAVIRVAEVAHLGRPTLIGSGADLLAAELGSAVAVSKQRLEPAAIAALAAGRTPSPPRPLYLRAPDAKLPGGKSLPA